MKNIKIFFIHINTQKIAIFENLLKKKIFFSYCLILAKNIINIVLVTIVTICYKMKCFVRKINN